ncbi:hypothetical protein [Cellvibrio sp.]|uniref:hypothetical protein n=1 Tax=Cellvibrio sp. TaxID=1965322 RepID=UPI0039647CB2
MRNKIIVALTFIGFATLIYFGYEQDDIRLSSATSDISPAEKIESPDESTTQFARKTTPPVLSPADKILMDKNKRSEYQTWRHDRGYADENTKNNYDAYSDEILVSLTKQNDIFATQTLAKRQYEKERDGKLDFIKTKALYYRAAAQGSTYALDELSILDAQLSSVYQESSPALAYKYSLDARAWAEVKKMRGDTFSSFLGAKMIPETFAETELIEIREQAKNLFDDLSSQRQQLNLGAFDNAVSEWDAAMLEKINTAKVSHESK